MADLRRQRERKLQRAVNKLFPATEPFYRDKRETAIQQLRNNFDADRIQNTLNEIGLFVVSHEEKRLSRMFKECLVVFHEEQADAELSYWVLGIAIDLQFEGREIKIQVMDEHFTTYWLSINDVRVDFVQCDDCFPDKEYFPEGIEFKLDHYEEFHPDVELPDDPQFGR